MSRDPYYEPPLSACPEPIAVIGMGCRLPGHVRSPADFWELMAKRRTGQTNKVPKERFNIDAYLHENLERPGSFNMPGGYFLEEDVREFDPAFFGISPVEATWMDPQQRKLLEVVYECLESAGVTLDQISGTMTGCYVATFTADYQQLTTKEPDFRHNYAAIGIDPGILSARISHFLNINGPSFIVNTACSSSIYALHSAVTALQHNEVEGAIVGGSNLILTVDQHMNTAKLGVLSPTSTCHTFDESADGYGRAEGIGALYLKRLSDAMRDGDNIRAVIRSTATNTNGKSAANGITHPSGVGQKAVMREAHRRGGNLNPLLCGYFECHGTGTPVGDPVEVKAVSKAMNENRMGDEPLIIGAVKPNIGHSEAASGVAAVIKAVMMVEKGLIPPVYGFKNPNPAIDFKGLKVKVADKVQQFPQHLPIHRVCVNSFGYGGTNGHAIIDSLQSILPYTPTKVPRLLTAGQTPRRRPSKLLLPFSAHDKPTLLRIIAAHREHVTRSDSPQDDIAYTLSNHRSRFGIRGFAVADERQFAEYLKADAVEIGSGDNPKLGFVFTGQGAQWPKMGVELFEAFPPFRETIARLDSVLHTIEPSLQWHIEDALRAGSEGSQVHQVELSQPLCTAVQVGIIALLDSWGIHPSATVGHSSGEIAAAYAAKLITAEEAILVAYYRGKAVSQRKREGAMIAVGLGAPEARIYLSQVSGQAVVACENSPESVTVSGDAGSIEALATRFKENGIFHRVLRTGGLAYHSPHMVDYAHEYGTSIRSFDPAHLKSWVSSSAEMMSSVTGTYQSLETLKSTYWVRNLTQPVRFDTAVNRLLDSSEVNMLVEIGPHSALAGPIRQILAQRKATSVRYLSSLIRGADSSAEILKLAGKLFLAGISVDFTKINRLDEIQPKLLPNAPLYQWNYGKLLWGETRFGQDSRALTHKRHDLLGTRVLGGVKSEPTWRNLLRLKDLPWLIGHRLGSENVLAASAYLAMAMEARMQLNEFSGDAVRISNFTFRDVTIQKALVIPDDDFGVEVLFSSKQKGHWLEYSVHSVANGVWTTHATGRIAVNISCTAVTKTPTVPLAQVSSGGRWYQAFNDIGFCYSGPFVGIGSVRSSYKATEALAETKILKQTAKGESRYVLHPSSMDMSLQVLLVSICRGQVEDLARGFVPVGADQITVHVWNGKQQEVGKTFSHIHREGLRSRFSSLQLVDGRGKLLMDMQGLHHMEFDGLAEVEKSVTNEAFWCSEWKPDVTMASGAQLERYFSSSAPENLMRDLLELYIFREPRLKILEVLAGDGKPVVGNLGDAHPHIKAETIVVSSGVPLAPQAPHYDVILFPSADWGIVSALAGACTIGHILTNGDQGTPGLRRRFRIRNTISALTLSEDDLSCSDSSSDHSDLGSNKPITIVYDDADRKTKEMVEALELEAASGRGLPDLQSFALEDLPVQLSEEDVIYLDIGTSVLAPSSLTGSAFERVGAISNAKSILWVTNGGLGSRPEFSLPIGLARSLRSERASLQLTTLDVDLDSQSLEAIANAILAVFSRGDKHDNEFFLKDGTVQIGRLRPTVEPEKPSSGVFGPPTLVRNGLKTDFVFTMEPSPEAPRPGEVEIEIMAVGINSELYVNPDETTFSHEFSGVVTRIGEDVKNVEVGAHVMGLGLEVGGHFQTVPAEFVHRIDDKDFAEAAAIPLAFTTAVEVLRLAGVQKGDKMVVLRSSGVVGQAILRLANAMDIDVCALASTRGEQTTLIKSSGLQQARFATAEECFGFSVIIAAEDDPQLQELWRGIASFGRLIALKSAIDIAPALDMHPFRKHAQFMVYDLKDYLRGNPQLVANSFKKAAELFIGGAITGSEARKKFDLALLPEIKGSNARSWGEKVVVSYESGREELTLRPNPKEQIFSPDAYYLLVGCLGGVGRSLTNWMVERGARHLILMGRTGDDKPEAAELVRGLRENGVDVVVARGDVARKSDVQHIKEQLASLQFPLRGIIQGAMVLDDCLFDQLTASRFTAATRPKVTGTHNLHEIFLDTPLDFFIMTSSVSATLGTQGQSNYSAANSYLDTLALHRRKLGLPAVSLILPMILGVGYVADHPEIEEGLNRKGIYGIDELELLNAFGKAVTYGGSDIVVGMDPKRLSKALGRGHTTDPFWFDVTRLNHITASVTASRGAGNSRNASTSIRALVQSAPDPEIVVVNHIIEKLARLLLRDGETIEPQHSVSYYGLDSMIGTEFRNWIFREFGCDLSLQFLVSQATSIGDIGRRVCEELGVAAA